MMTKGKFRRLVVGTLLISILAVGLVALAGNDFRRRDSSDWRGRQAVGACSCPAELMDTDGDGIPNCEDEDYACPLDGSGCGRMQGTKEAQTPAVSPDTTSAIEANMQQVCKDGRCWRVSHMWGVHSYLWCEKPTHQPGTLTRCGRGGASSV